MVLVLLVGAFFSAFALARAGENSDAGSTKVPAVVEPAAQPVEPASFGGGAPLPRLHVPRPAPAAPVAAPPRRRRRGAPARVQEPAPTPVPQSVPSPAPRPAPKPKPAPKRDSDHNFYDAG
jgi:outer membrane biosynthesis protein TonB